MYKRQDAADTLRLDFSTLNDIDYYNGVVFKGCLLYTSDLDDEHEEDNAVVTLADGVYEVGGDVPVNELEGLLGEDIFENAD